MKLNQEEIEELRCFIVVSGLDRSFLDQLENSKNRKRLSEWLGLTCEECDEEEPNPYCAHCSADGDEK